MTAPAKATGPPLRHALPESAGVPPSFGPLADTLHEALLFLTPDLRVQATNAAFHRLFDLPKVEAEGRIVYEIGNGGWDIPALHHLLEQSLIAADIVEGVEITHRFGGETERSVIINSRRIAQPALILLALEDVTELRRRERQHVETALAESRTMFQLVLDHIPQGVFWKDCAGRFLGANTVAARASGFESPQELVGLTDRDLPGVTPEQAAHFRETDREVRESGRALLDIEEPLGKPDGTTAWLRTSKVPLRSGDGRIVGVLGTWEDITEKKEAERRIRQSESAFRQLADAMPQLVWAATPEGRVDYYNNRADQYAGLSLAAGIWKWTSMVHPDDIERTIEAWRAAVKTGSPYEIEHRIQLADGTFCWHLSRGVPYRDEEGRITRWYGTATDIHALKTAEEHLRRAQEAARVGTWDWDPATGEVVWSEGIFELTGLPPEGGVPSAQAWEALIHPDDLEQMTRRLHAALETGGVYENEFRICRPDGRCVWVAAQGHVVCDSNGHPVRLMGVNFDITARKEAEIALRHLNEELEERVRERTLQVLEERERFSATLQASSWLAWSTNAEGAVEEDSPSWRLYTGQSYDDWKGFGWLDAVHPDDRFRTAERWRHSIETGAPLEAEYRLWHAPSGSWCWQLARAVPLRDQDGAIRGWAGINADIAERKQAEERVRQLSHALTLAEQEERRRLSEVLHDDLQQILVAAKMRTFGLQAETSDSPGPVAELQDILGRAVEVTRTLSLELNPPVLRGEGLAPALRWLARHMEQMHLLQVTIDVQEDLPPLGKDLHGLIVHLVRELLFNVVKHAGTDHARVSGWSDEGCLVLLVEDEGVGFDPHRQREDTASLGLFTVEERLRLVGGAVHVDSRPGGGTHITIEIPLPPPANR